MAVENVHIHISQEVDDLMTAPRASTASSVASEPAKFLLIALWFALVTGLGEVLLLGIAKFLLHRYINYFGRDMIWMAPLAEVFFFGIVAVILLILASLRPRLISWRLALFLLAFLGVVNLLLIYQRLHEIAVVVLALGIAIQTARFLANRIDGFFGLVRRTTAWTVALIVLLGIATWGLQSMAEQRALARLPAFKPGAPNVLLIVMDTVRARNLSLYGYARPTTPELEMLAKKGVVFRRAISTAPWTLPSHASMFTGRNQHDLSVGFASKLDSTHPTLAEVLSSEGYVTAGFVANTWYVGRASGLDRGFAYYEDLVVSPGQIIVSSTLGRAANNNFSLRRVVDYSEVFGRKTASEINESFLGWLSRKEPQRPFFAFINYFDAHEPYLPPEPFEAKFGPNVPRKNPRHDNNWNWTPSEIQAEMDAYDGAIASLDHYIGKLFEELRKRGVLDNTLVIITSDHGEEFGEHGIMDHGYSLYLPLLHVPLLVSFPNRVPVGKSIDEPVSIRDLPSTVLDLLKLNDEHRFPGATLARFWDASTPKTSKTEFLLSELEFTPHLPDSYPISKGNMKSLITNEYQYIRNGDNREELYHLESDPLQKQNLADTEEGREVCKRFRTVLEETLTSNQSTK